MSQPVLIVRVQSLQVAIGAAAVKEIVGARSWVPVPGARPELPGVLAWGGRAVAVLDLARVAAGLTPLSPTEQRQRSLLVQVRDSMLAIPVDWVSELRELDDKDIRSRRVHDFPLARAEADLGDAVVPLLDPLLLLDPTEAHGLRS
jgi:chemotaxis signal transduction protein